MQSLHKCRNFVQFNRSFFQSLTLISSSSHVAWFHSTPVSEERRGQPPSSKPSKKAIKFEVRQKRSDAKKALNKLLFDHGCINRSGGTVRFTVQGPSDEEYDEEDYAERSNKKNHSKYSSKRGIKAQHKRNKRKLKRDYEDSDSDDYDSDEHTNPMDGTGKRFLKKDWEESYYHQKSRAGFEWKQTHNQKTNTRRHSNNNTQWSYTSGTDYKVESSCSIGSYTQRSLLGLPTNGPIKLDDVKTAFRSSALKWHPDKHQGPQQAVAEEKFKHCVDAYKSICNMLPKV